MKDKRRLIQDLERDLFQAHRDRPAPRAPENWSDRVMSQIHRVAGGVAEGATELGLAWFRQRAFTRLSFRFAGAGVVVAAALLIYLMVFSPDLNLAAAKLYLTEPMGYLLGG